MVYDGFQAKDLGEACAEFTLWHHEAFSKRQLGGIRLSLGTGEGTPSPPQPLGVSPESQLGVTGWCLRREQLRAARGLDGLHGGGAGRVEAAAAAARALGGGSAAPADQPRAPGIAPSPCGSLCGLGSVPSPSSTNEVAPEGTSGSFLLLWAHLGAVHCTGTVPWLLPQLWGCSCCVPLLPVRGCAPVAVLPAPGLRWPCHSPGWLCQDVAFLTGIPTLVPVPWSLGGLESPGATHQYQNILWAGTAKSPKGFFATRISRDSSHCWGSGVTGGG